MLYRRLLTLPKRTFFLFGPRGTGKTVWLSQTLGNAPLVIDLLRASTYLQYKRDPSRFAREASALPPGAWIVVDEVQKLPELLDEVHALLFASQNSLRFALSGSSARKLKRGNANMLAGRAWPKKMFPLSVLETGDDCDLEDTLRYGRLPMSVTAGSVSDKIEFLDAYMETYLREEIWQEAFVRNLDSFHRFLTVAAIFNGQLLNISNIARDVGVARSTVQGYFGILEDTLLGWTLPAWRIRAKVKETARPKFYLFDCGVQRAMAGLLRDSLSPFERGLLFETWMLNELRALNAWSSQGAKLFYWRTESGTEVDVIWQRGRRAVGLEIKSTSNWKASFHRGLNTLLHNGAIERGFGIYTGDTVQKFDNICVLPYRIALQKAWEGELLR